MYTTRWQELTTVTLTQHADKVNQQLLVSWNQTFPYKHLVGFQVLRCCISDSRHTQSSLTVSRAEARQGNILSAHRAAQVYGVSSVALELFSLHTPVLRLPMLITDCCLVSQRPRTALLGRERRCDDQVTEAYCSNAHLIATGEEVFLFIVLQQRKNNETVIRYSTI